MNLNELATPRNRGDSRISPAWLVGRDPVLVRRLLLFLFAALVSSEVLLTAFEYHTEWYHHDRYWFLDAAVEVANTGIPRLPSLPNSSYGMDLIAWTHHFPTYVYAVGVSLFDMKLWHLVLIQAIELALILWLVAALFRRFVSISWSIALAALVLLEPTFSLHFVEQKFGHWALIFGWLSFMCVIPSTRSRSPRMEIGLHFAGGFCAAMAPLSFVSVGIPMFIALAVIHLVETWRARPRARNAPARLGAFALGVATPVLIVALHVFQRMGPDEIGDLVRCMSRYGLQVASNPESQRSFLEVARFAATLLVPYTGVSLLPVGIAALMLNLSLYREIPDTGRFLVRATAISTGVSLALGAIAPLHFSSGRMCWILPLYLLQILIALRTGPAHPVRFGSLVCFAAAVLAVQAANVLLGIRLPGASFALLPAAAILLASMAAVAVWRSQGFRQRLGRVIYLHRRLLLILCVVLASSQELIRYADHWIRHLPLALGQGSEPIAKRLIPELRRIAERELSSGDWVLTNAPIREFFPSGVRRQEIFFWGKTVDDPGLAGARKEPAAKALLIVSEASDLPSGEIHWYGDLSVGRTIYYAGHLYRLNERLPLIPGFHLLIGDPVTIAREGNVSYPLRVVSKRQVEAYLEWRERSGIPVD